jgi:hypothetical protein
MTTATKNAKKASRNALSGLYAKPGRNTPLAAAKALRIIFNTSIPPTFEDTILPAGHEYSMTAWWFCKMIQEQSGCTFRQASNAGYKVAPTLWCTPAEWHAAHCGQGA